MSNERRTKARYPLELAIHYETLGAGQPISGAGRTVNVSSSGVLFAAEQGINEGSRVKLTMQWPTLLNGITPLQLVTTGKVVRSQDQSVGVAFDWYQFRTMRRTAAEGPAFTPNAAAATARSSHNQPTDPFRLRNVG